MAAGLVAGPDLVGLGYEAAAYLAFQVITFAPVLVLVKRAWPDHNDPWSLADLLFSTVFFPILTVAAIAASFKLCSTVELRWVGVCPEARFFMMLYTTRGILHIFVQFCEDMKMSLLLAMTLHHVLSIICFGAGLVNDRMHFWGCLDGVCEMSTVFLNTMMLMREVQLGGKALKELIPRWVYAANSVCLWLAFLFFRLMLFPCWLYWWYTDITTVPAETWDKSSSIERYLYPAVTVCLLVLSVSWFVPLTKGTLKAVGLTSRKEEKEA